MPGQAQIDSEDRQPDIEQLYRLSGPAILGYLRRIVGDGEAARDLLQETFAQALKFPERLNAAGSRRAWLFGVARRLALNWLRRGRRAGPLPADLADGSPQADGRLEQMRQEIRRLPDAMREALELRLTDELSYREIAAVLEIPVGTVRSRIHHAVRQLRRRLAEDEA
jgi:RNA polymerase sigma-70 factor (ECF subfamily)